MYLVLDLKEGPIMDIVVETLRAAGPQFQCECVVTSSAQRSTHQHHTEREHPKPTHLS